MLKYIENRFPGKVLWVDKHVFVINGSGGVGKDTFCQAAEQFWRVQNISSITPICTLARAAGWDGEKTPAARRFLSELKQACTAFNDLPLRYCVEQYQVFMQNDRQILFVHIREPEQIDRFRQAVGPRCKAILVRRPAMEQSRGPLGNYSDDNVADYVYDGVFINDSVLEALPERVHWFLKDMIG